MQFCVDSSRMSHWNLSDHSITFARWRHIPSLLAQSLQSAVTRALQRVACGVRLRRWENQRRLSSFVQLMSWSDMTVIIVTASKTQTLSY